MSRSSIVLSVALFAGCQELPEAPPIGRQVGYSLRTLDPGCAGSPYATVQSAIDDAGSGDVIEVCAGTFTERLTISGKTLTLRSQGGAGTTTVDAAGLGKALVVKSGADVVVEGLSFAHGQTGSTGANVECSASTLTLRDSVLRDGTGQKGGGLGAKDCDGVIEGNTFEANTATLYGGGVYISGGNLEARDNVIVGNDAVYKGGGLYLVGSAPVVANTFDGNHSTIGGGALVTNGYGDITGNLVIGNTSSDDGAGIYIDRGRPRVDGNTFELNDAGDEAGGLRLKLTEATVTNNLFRDNHASYRGGAIKVSHDEVVMSGNTYIDNTASSYGGAVYMFESASEVTHETFIGNDADKGGSLAVGPGWGGLLVEDCTFESSHTSYQGGILYLNLPGQTTTLRRVSMSGGTASYGGAIWSVDSDIAFENVQLYDNRATVSGGALYLDDVTGDVVNAVVYGNTAPAGSAVTVVNGTNDLGLTNTAFVDNVSSAAIHVDSGVAPSVRYDAFDGNTADFSGMADAIGVDGNISAAPMFVAPASGDFTLQGGSPLVNAGDPAIEDVDGTRSDIGRHGGPEGSAAAPDVQAPTVPQNLSSPSQTPSTITLAWDASTDDVGVVAYRVYGPAGTTDVSTTSWVQTGLASDTEYDFQVSALDAAGNESALSSVLSQRTEVSSGVVSVSVRIAAKDDDAEETVSNGWVRRSSTDLEITEEGSKLQLIGLRFDNLAIPAGATIQRATVQFTTDEISAGAASFEIVGEAADDGAFFATTVRGLSNRPTTSASATWTPADWNVVGESGPAQETTDLSAVLQEIVDRPGWSSGNAAVFLISGSGTRVAESHEGVAADAPLLRVDYLP